MEPNPLETCDYNLNLVSFKNIQKFDVSAGAPILKALNHGGMNRCFEWGNCRGKWGKFRRNSGENGGNFDDNERGVARKMGGDFEENFDRK